MLALYLANFLTNNGNIFDWPLKTPYKLNIVNIKIGNVKLNKIRDYAPLSTYQRVDLLKD